MKLKASLHIHTSDDPEHALSYTTYDLIDKAKEFGFSVLALTCHNYFAWKKEYADYAKSRGIMLIPGIEVGILRGKVSKEGLHVLILGCNKDAENIYTFEDLRRYKEKHKDVFVIAPHPYFYGDFSLKRELEKNIDLFDAIEHSWFYSKWFNRNKKAEILAKKYNKPLIATSDTHFFTYFNKHYATLSVKEFSQKAVFDAISNFKFKNTTSPCNFLKDMILRYGIFYIQDKVLFVIKNSKKRFKYIFNFK